MTRKMMMESAVNDQNTSFPLEPNHSNSFEKSELQQQTYFVSLSSDIIATDGILCPSYSFKVPIGNDSDKMKKKVLSEGALSSMIDVATDPSDDFSHSTNSSNITTNKKVKRVHSSPDVKSLLTSHQTTSHVFGKYGDDGLLDDHQPGLDLTSPSDPLLNTNPEQFAANIIESNGFSPIFYSALSLAGFFLQPTEKQIASYDHDITGAVRAENLNMLREMIQQDRPMQCCNRFGESIIHMACRMGSSDVIRFFLQEAQVSIRICDDFGRTPLHDACWAREPNFDLVLMLLQSDPDLILIRDKRGHSPLSYVRREHWTDWCKFLKQYSELLIPVDLGTRKI